LKGSLATKIFRRTHGFIRREIYQFPTLWRIIRSWREADQYAQQDADLLKSNQSPLISIIVPTFRRIGSLVDCIRSIRQYTSNYEIIVVNSGSGILGDLWLISQRRAGDLIVIFDNGRVLGRRVRSQSYFYNLGYRAARGKYVIHFADDCRALPGWTDDVIHILESDAQVGLALFLGQPHEFGKFQHTIYRGQLDGHPQNYPVAHWFCARKDDLAALGYMDEGYNYYCNDIDLTVRMMVVGKKRVVCSTKSRILHLDKSLVRREKLNVDADVHRFNEIWATTVGFRVDDMSKVVIIGEGEERTGF
jgi:GT2 family glycosyltransferase